MIIISPIIINPTSMPQAMLEVDVDVDADRLVIVDRNSFEVLIHKHVSGVFRCVLPSVYINSNKLLVGILDDNGEYNAVFFDGIQPKIIDGLLIDITS